METTATKIDVILNAIREDIAILEILAEDAMNTIENLNATPEEFKQANLVYGFSSYGINYLNRIKAVVMEGDIKKAENIIRYHSHYQYTKGNLDDGSVISVSQMTVTATLEEYIERFFK